ncbi:MAG: peptide ABC transporter ATP-binding protein [Tistrella sp.]|uniref:ABC transporter ATP-binding protein n=1 Tax=Tistrella sp. TaxID=2024861 RepID=UPI000C5685F2|nr:ABC transporter ATP-binding protein [Tistrella sp.]MAD38190.1 peptide ABC transporter ATP-binding protein [Tistrella sp.]MBA77112.1 peptide ABC transporter ATP-binding protein [Tistrella sp.]
MTSPLLLDIQNLSVGLEHGPTVVEDASLSIARGRILAVVGESGSGKTVVSRAVLDLLPSPLIRRSGRILFDGRDITTLEGAARRKVRGGQIGMVFQEPMVSLNPALSVGAQLVEGLMLHEKIGRAEARERALAMLARIRIDDPARCFGAWPHEFSGGMRQRIMLASVMLLKPRLLIADEPTTALDTLVQREVLELMVELARENDTAILLVSHDLGLVARYADDVVVMRGGRVIERGPTARILLDPQHDYTRNLLEAMPRPRRLAPPARAGVPVVEARDLVVIHKGRRRMLKRQPDKRAVDGVSFQVAPGETLALVGESGSGKTTIGRCLVGLTRPSGGQLTFRGTDLARASGAEARARRLDCQMVFQDPFSSLDPRHGVGRIVAEPLRHVPGLAADEARRRVDEVLEEVGLGSAYAKRLPHELSGGQRQRVAIARAIVRRPAFVVADEAVSALDMTVQAQVLDLFGDLQQRHGFSCLFITHALSVVRRIAHRVAVMKDGRIVETAETEELFARPRHDYTRALLAAAPVLEPAAGGGWRLAGPANDRSAL